MKRLLLIMHCPLWSMAQWTDNFSSNLTNWQGDTALFEIDSTQQLQLNAPAVANSAFLWNGIDDDGRKAAIGRYIIYLEAINDSGKIVKAKKSCVLGGRL